MTDVRRTYNGKWELRWREGGRGSRRHSRTFDRKSDATNYEAWLRRRRQLGHAAVPDDVKLGEFVETYWQLHAMPNLSPATRTLYRRVWALHVLPRLGDYGVRELTPKRLTRFRAELEKCRRRHRDDREGDDDRPVDPVVRGQRGARRVQRGGQRHQAPLRARPRAAHLPPGGRRGYPRQARSLRDRTLVSVLAYSGPRPEEVVCRLTWNDVGEHAIRYVDTKRHRIRHTPLLEAAGRDDLQRVVPRVRSADRQSAGVPGTRRRLLERGRLAQLAPAHLAGRARAPAPGSQEPDPCTPRRAPTGTRPRDLRSSYVTLRVYEGIPLTQIAREVGTSVPDDRAALRRRDRELGRQTATRGGLDSSCSKGLHPGLTSNWWTECGRKGRCRLGPAQQQNPWKSR